MSLRIAAKLALLTKTAAADATGMTPESTPADMFMEQMKKQQQVQGIVQEGIKTKAKQLDTTKMRRDLERKEQEITTEQENQEREQAEQTAQQQAEMQAAAQAAQAEATAHTASEPTAPGNAMQTAAQQQAMQQQDSMPKTAGAAPMYFGIPDRSKLHMFTPDFMIK